VQKPVTAARAQAEGKMNVSVLALSTVQRIAKLAEEGRYEDAMSSLVATQQLIKRNAASATQSEEYLAFVAETAELESVIADGQRKTRDGKSQRDQDDQAAKVLFKMKHQNQVAFLSGDRKREVVASRKKHNNKAIVKLL